MISNEQAVKACIIAQFLTDARLIITSFRYYQGKEIIFIECGIGGEIGLEINTQGDVKIV